MTEELKIEAGKFYRTRDGQKVGPAKYQDDASGQKRNWLVSGCAYRSDGTPYDTGGYNWPLDLVALWADEPASPVRTVTRREIVPGMYAGDLVEIDRNAVVSEDGVSLWLPRNHRWIATDLRAAAAIFTQLADALDEQKP